MSFIMASVKLNLQDKRDMEKFTKFLALKTTQVIVQSRLGEKIHTKCKPNTSGIDWFNLSIQDLSDVLGEAKKAIYGGVVTNKLPLCVEISLRTIDGHQLMLETWALGVLPDQCDPSVKVTCTAYNRMGLLLKSLICITRITPAYKLSRQQSSDSFIIYYRIYMGEPEVSNLGEGHKQIRVGQMCTPVGTLYLTVAYRTKMTISPTDQREIMVKSDHFHPDLSPKHKNSKNTSKKEINLEVPLKTASFSDRGKIRLNIEDKIEHFSLPERSPFSWMVNNTARYSDWKTENEEENRNGNEPENGSNNNCPEELSKVNVNTANKACPRDTNESKSSSDESCAAGIAVPARRASVWSRLSSREDVRFTKDLHFAFATNGSPVSELRMFLDACPVLPSANDGNSDTSHEETRTMSLEKLNDKAVSSDDITKQFEMFESTIEEFDSMVASLCHSPGSS